MKSSRTTSRDDPHESINTTFNAAVRRCDKDAIKSILKYDLHYLSSQWMWLRVLEEETRWNGWNIERVSDLLVEHDFEEEIPQEQGDQSLRAGTMTNPLNVSRSDRRPPLDRIFTALIRRSEEYVLQLILDNNFEDLTGTDKWKWLEDVIQLGYTTDRISRLLVEHQEQRPWISFEPPVTTHRLPGRDWHVAGCIHHPDDVGDDFMTRQPDDFSDTSAVEVNHLVASLCGLAGFVPSSSWFESNWCSEVSFAEQDQSQQAVALIRCQNHVARHISSLRGFCTAAAELQRTGRCCDSYTVLCKTGERSVQACQIPFDLGVKMLVLLDDVSKRKRRAWEDLTSCAVEIVRRIPGLTTILDTWRNSLSICALAEHILCLSLASYSQGHTGDLDLFFLECSLKGVDLLGTDSSDVDPRPMVRFQPIRLSCLDGMLEAPVMAFTVAMPGDPWIEPHQENRENGAHDLIATPEQILDIWGPGFIIPEFISEAATRSACIVIGGGVVYPVADGKYHWTRRLDVSHAYHLAKIDLKEPIEIGANVEVANGLCSHNISGMRAKSAEYRRPLGTYDPFWLHDREREIGAQVGMYVVPQFVSKSQKNDGISLKKREMDRLRAHRLDPAFLESTWGLQVSLCSGFAKRVKIRELLADLLPLYAERYIHQYPEWEKLRDDFNIPEELRQGNKALLKQIGASDRRSLLALCDLIEGLMSTLQTTGIDTTGRHFIVALFPTSHEEPIESLHFTTEADNLWTNILRDTSMTCTFAYFTTSCLQLKNFGCRMAEARWHGQVPFLETEVYRAFESRPTKTTASTFRLEDGDTYAIGPETGIQRLVWMSMALHAAVVRPHPAEDARLIVRQSLIPQQHLRRMMLKPSRGRLQERSGPGVEVSACRAFIMSREDERLMFA
ncbi:hypothetical protein M409DRAFT_59356 [Zasmidium cellare ATCC 36951]|uniref:Uncharacterized protein n=1 Tax=Zasmidium cellare ATCC 36951 TaxID=1080233 RepID=A0A6A6C221_ZASCE|nr:uncharacterized protein M409DRAFT_59356 [Zasmidium cellare ATCC 36951]KAF2161081.1 hypothetical protein M409DRAFT_59356 [Zasmidium cellare ATCC 36951]